MVGIWAYSTHFSSVSRARECPLCRTRNTRDRTAQLFLAARNGHDDCMQLLIEAGADVSQPDSEGETALHHAAKDGWDKCVKLLIEEGADVNHPDIKGETALHKAVRGGWYQCVQILIEARAYVDAGWRQGKSALLCAASSEMNVMSCGKALLNAGADVNKCDQGGRSALHLVCGRGKVGFVELLIQAGPDVNQQDDQGWSPLCEAVSKGHLDCVNLLMEAGAPGCPRWPAP